MTREEIMAEIAVAESALNDANKKLADFDEAPENNVFETLEMAEGVLEAALRNEARADCEGSYNCGADTYQRRFIVGGKEYIGTLTVEYNRHDKTYYYIEEASFSYVAA